MKKTFSRGDWLMKAMLGPVAGTRTLRAAEVRKSSRGAMVNIEGSRAMLRVDIGFCRDYKYILGSTKSPSMGSMSFGLCRNVDPSSYESVY